MSIILLTIALLVVYPYLLYPILLPLLSATCGRPLRTRPWCPRVSVLLAAHNEAAVLSRKLENTLALDYPAERIEILVGSDGSTDDTVACARRFTDSRLRIFSFPERRGKAAVVNDLASASTGEVLLLTDASALVPTDALRQACSILADPSVATVTGQMVPFHGQGVTATLDAYRRFDNYLRRHESRVHSSMGAAGAFYTIRREHFSPPPAGTILDDFVIPMSAVARGFRLIATDTIAVAELDSTTMKGEFRRKVRTLAGNYQALARLKVLLRPRWDHVWFLLLSHKVLRLLTPFGLLALLVLNVALLPTPSYSVLFLLQLSFYFTAALGFLLRHRPRPIRLVHFPYLFILLQAASFFGFCTYVSGRASHTWSRPAPR